MKGHISLIIDTSNHLTDVVPRQHAITRTSERHLEDVLRLKNVRKKSEDFQTSSKLRNTRLETWSPNTLRAAGLCEDHFVVTSFKNPQKIKLRRDAVPIPYDKDASSAHKDNIEIREVQRDVAELSLPNHQNIILEKEELQQSAVRTYGSGTVLFDITAEEEDVMEWMHLEPEPHTRENVKRYVARRCIEKNDCNYCRQIMLKTPMEDVTANEKYIEYREYPNADEDAPIVTKLVRPTNLFINIIKTQLMTFNRSWQHHWASTQLLEKMINE
ncbi:uncharacterized protein LOC112590642, partial [Harpegnathos saltator]|uniref:uncharacterized protein LOC112590642 n=1 Tax=Harpegnathos saltator TaxID=610380 RepID=UPI000DBED7C5